MFNKLVLLSLASLVLADSESFGLLVIRTALQYQNIAVALVDDVFTAGTTGNYITASITDDGLLKLSDGTYAVVGINDISTGTEAEASGPWAISNTFLTYEGGETYGIEDGVITAGAPTESGAVPYWIAAITASGSWAADFTPGSSNSTNSTSSSASHSSTASSSSSSSSTFITQIGNGAALKSVGLGAVLAAGAALLI